ncbi:MAG: DUF262 domain-containing protein [Rhizobiaceae bacterium]|nr:DUF262 domain-containing protein [Rhizobiaceae bacterium]
MKAGPIEVGNLLQNRNRFCVPIYQRHYVWNAQKQWEPFWNDIRTKAIERLSGRQRRFSHFMGAVVLEARGGFSARRVPAFQVVDGQQRLTTFQIFLAAARDYAKAIGYQTGVEAIGTYLLNRDPQLMEHPEVEIFKVWPTQYDRELFMDIVAQSDRAALRKKYSAHFYKTRDQIYDYRTTPRLLAGYGYFYDKIRHSVETDDLDDEFFEAPETPADSQEDELSENASNGEVMPKELRLDALWQALVEEFKVVEITLEDGDDAQVIFETLNERGEPLLAADLVRNNIFQRADAAGRLAEKLFDKYWKPFEDPFWSAEEKQGRYKKARIEFFLANYISSKIASEVNLTKLFSEYKAFIKRSPFASVEAELSEINRFGAIYAELTKRKGESQLSRFARRLSPWEVSTVFPLAMRLWDAPEMDEDEKGTCLDLLMSFIVRRAVCGLTTKNYNKFFLTVIEYLNKEGPSLLSLSAYLQAQKSDTGRFPRDQEFEARWNKSPIYQSLKAGRVRSILEEIELARRTKFQETISLKEGLTVEHLMPQNWRENWPLPGGEKPTADDFYNAIFAPENEKTTVGRIVRRNRLMNSIGNLTLLTQPLNSSVSNGPYKEKWKTIRAQSLLMISRGAMDLESWDEQAIENRAKDMFALAKNIWPDLAQSNLGGV